MFNEHGHEEVGHKRKEKNVLVPMLLLNLLSLKTKTMFMKTYYNPEDLKKFGNIGEFEENLAKKFFDYYGDVFKEGALTAREKSLIALAVAHTIQCPYCIDAYTTDTMQKGCDENQVMEAVHVAAAIRGGSSLVHGVQMMNKYKELSM
jgi:alkylhydroperoxidase/carboxymuconolactone decarboxylase family protein